MTLMCMKLKRFAFFTQKVIILSFLATRTKKEQSFTRPSNLKKKKLQNNIITPWQIRVITIGLFQANWVHQVTQR